MNILMISDVYFPRINGVSTSIITFRQELLRLGHQVMLVAPDYGQCSADEQHILRIPARQLPFDPEDRIMLAKNIFKQRMALRRQRFDIVHIQTPFIAHYVGVKLAKELRIPRIETYHTFFEEYFAHYIPLLPNRLLRGAARLFSRRQCNNLDGLIVPSQAMYEVLQEYRVKTPMRIIPTGINPHQFRNGKGLTFRVRHGISPTRPTLVHVGRVAFEKNIDFLLYMVEKLKQRFSDILLIIAGEGPALPHLRQLGKQLGISANLLFVGYLPRETTLADCYQAGDVFVFASRTETQGLVLLEAMSLGVPVVSTAVMGTKSLLNADCGALVAEENVADFAAKVTQILENFSLRQKLAKAGKTYARHWGTEKPAQQLLAFYRDLLNGNTDCCAKAS
jgi:glycosyltransferase involved in cell wall biosynthesis